MRHCRAIDLTGRRTVPATVLQAMADAIVHRGPDEDGYLQRSRRLGLASRRLSIVGLADGRQPICNEDGTRLGRLQRRTVRLPRAPGRAGGAAATAFAPTATPS